MSVPNIDTFEHDISEEIKTKEATIGDIASAGGDIGNAPVRTSSVPAFLVALGILLVVAVIAISVVLFLKYSSMPTSVPTTGTNTGGTQAGVRMSSVSVTVNGAVGQSIGVIQKSGYGYTINLASYSDVFAYMLKNEKEYADELASAVGSARDTSTTTPPFSFTDVTINNQNMRVGVSGTKTVVYAFVNTKILLISSSTEGILALRGAILR